MHHTLLTLAKTCGYACVAIGSAQFLLGAAMEPGFDRTSAPVDSQVRFFGPVFAGYGLAWIAAACGDQPDLRRMRALSRMMALGGLGRLISRARVGHPHPFQDLLTVVELVWPATVEAMARSPRP